MPSPRHLPLNRRLTTLLLSVLALITVFSLLLSFSSGHQESGPISSHPSTAGGASHINVNPETLKGGVISSKIGNETLKAELGRAAWKLLHTTMAKFPDKPNEDEQTALLSYIHLGECASHFQTILSHFPPQVSTRSTAAVWACHVHNEVNRSLKKEEFDCSKIGDFYDCGCADEDDDDAAKKEKDKGGEGKAKEDARHSGEGQSKSKSIGDDRIDLSVERNGPTQGA